MGLERTASVLQGVPSNFEIDILRPLCLASADAVGIAYDFAGVNGRPIRRIADHVRAITFSIHEGVSPGSEKESYVVRQLLRRALLEGYLLGRHEPFLHKLVPAVVVAMKAAYPEIAKTEQTVANAIREEEDQFLGVVEKGLAKFERCVEKTRSGGSARSPATTRSTCTQTDGFLIELTEAMAAEEEPRHRLERFKFLMNQHKAGAVADTLSIR